MAKDVLMPQMGYDMDAGTLLRWLKEPGDAVERGEPIAEIETDKVNIEIEAFDEGTFARSLIGEGDTVPVGEVIAIIAEAGEDIADFADDDSSTSTAAPEQAPAEPATPEPAQPSSETAQATSAQATAVVEREPGERIRASPLVRRLAVEHDIDLSQVAGSGPHGRIVRRDIEGMLTGAQPKPAAAPTPEEETEEAAAPEPNPAPEKERTGETVELSRMRQTIARRMSQSFMEAPHIFITMSVDMGKAMELRERINEELGDDEELTVNDLIVKATALALRKFPVLNAAWADGSMEMHDNIDINIAVAIEGGLISPFIAGADQKSLGEISRMTKDLARRARSGDLRPEEYAGGTFTISNLGMFGVDHFTAVINPPQAAILAIGMAQMKPVWNAEAEEFEPKFMMQVTIAADHRMTDGAEASLFLREFKSLLENPFRMVAG